MSLTDPTYLEYLAVAVVPVLLGLLAVPGARLGRRRWAGVGLVLCLALVYTTPWDNYLVAKRVWWYGDGVVLGTLWHAPVGEYLFVVLQCVVVALWLYVLLGRYGPTVPFRFGDVTRRDRLGGVVAGLGVGLAGVAMLFDPATYYLGAILAWGGPVLALQWGFAWRYLAVRWRVLVAGVGVPALYLSVVDRIALELGLWVISPRYTTGIAVGGLPIEEGAFFLVTTLFVVQALVLLEWVVASTPVDELLARLGVDEARVVVRRWG